MAITEDDIKAGLPVHTAANSMRIGVLTGRKRISSGGTLAEVEFGAEKTFKRISLLHSFQQSKSPAELVAESRFGKIGDFRSFLAANKVSSDLTDVFYSLGQDRTTFFGHQFLPVVKFIQSVPGRLLIADEVGLGKTIEAAYIWKEIEARYDAHSWLIICPAVLLEKWAGDLERLFSMDTAILKAGELLKELEAIKNGDKYKERIIITSLEGIRTNKKLAWFLELEQTSDEKLLGLVTVDEAHYLRNPGTKSHKIVDKLSNVSEHFLMLSATPIQTESLNLYNLLKLLEPDDFFDQQTFLEQNKQNQHIINAIRKLSAGEEMIGDAVDLLLEAAEFPFFKDNPLLEKILQDLSEMEEGDNAKRLQLASELERVSLFHRYINRTRKRDVISARVVREAREVQIVFNKMELAIYNDVTERLRKEGARYQNSVIFKLIMRQRQMGSCLPAAIKSWKMKEFSEEELWDDFGLLLEEKGEIAIPLLGQITDEQYKQLVDNDTKFNTLLTILKEIFQTRPEAKVILFSFFRETLKYLNERLSQYDFKSILFIGGIKDKTAVINAFKNDKGSRILLSSEIGSEGVDLQFCNIVMNYDLPWNPMRVEQRIGRVDRIGQEKEKIHIYNFVQTDSIEEKIYYRLLDRIGIFESSIGELEEIFGNTMTSLALELFAPNLTDQQREVKIKQKEESLINSERIQKKLEDEAWLLSGLTEYLIDEIDLKKEMGHWIRPIDLRYLIIDHLDEYYPGCRMVLSDDEKCLDLQLSPEASEELDNFVRQKRINYKTRLVNNKEVRLDFDVNSTAASSVKESITVRHPLIRWISGKVASNESLKPTVKIEMDLGGEKYSSGLYIFTVTLFSVKGLYRRKELTYSAYHVETKKRLSGKDSEWIILKALDVGKPYRGNPGIINKEDMEAAFFNLEEGITSCFEEFVEDTTTHNNTVILQQRHRINNRYERRTGEFKERIENFRITGRSNLIPMTEGLLRSEEEWRERQILKLNRLEDTTEQMSDIAAGMIILK